MSDTPTPDDDDQQSFILTFRHGGKEAVLVVDELNAKAHREFRLATGLKVMSAVEGMTEADLEAVAALWWFARVRCGETGLRFDDVLEETDLGTLLAMGEENKTAEAEAATESPTSAPD